MLFVRFGFEVIDRVERCKRNHLMSKVCGIFSKLRGLKFAHKSNFRMSCSIAFWTTENKKNLPSALYKKSWHCSDSVTHLSRHWFWSRQCQLFLTADNGYSTWQLSMDFFVSNINYCIYDCVISAHLVISKSTEDHEVHTMLYTKLWKANLKCSGCGSHNVLFLYWNALSDLWKKQLSYYASILCQTQAVIIRHKFQIENDEDTQRIAPNFLVSPPFGLLA